jgi:hypothetical protein
LSSDSCGASPIGCEPDCEVRQPASGTAIKTIRSHLMDYPSRKINSGSFDVREVRCRNPRVRDRPGKIAEAEAISISSIGLILSEEVWIWLLGKGTSFGELPSAKTLRSGRHPKWISANPRAGESVTWMRTPS